MESKEIREMDEKTLKIEIGLRYADTCGRCYFCNGFHDKCGFSAGYCGKHDLLEVMCHQVCEDFTPVPLKSE